MNDQVLYILLSVLAGFAFGVTLGWLLRGMGCRARIAALQSDLRQRSEHLEASAQQLDVLQNSLNDLKWSSQQDRERLQAQAHRLETQAQQDSAQCRALEQTVRQRDDDIADRDQQLRQLAPLEHELKVRHTTVQRLESQLRTQSEARDRYIRQLAGRVEQLEPLAERLSEKQCQIDELQRLTETLHANAGEHDSTIHRLQEELSELRRKANSNIEAPGRRLADRIPATGSSRDRAETASQHPDSGPRLSSTNPMQDDLKQIHGIGPVMERTLHDIGVTTFKQIADFTIDDVKRVAAAIKTFPKRIERDDWIGGAKRAYEAKYGPGR